MARYRACRPTLRAASRLPLPRRASRAASSKRSHARVEIGHLACIGVREAFVDRALELGTIPDAASAYVRSGTVVGTITVSEQVADRVEGSEIPKKSADRRRPKRGKSVAAELGY